MDWFNFTGTEKKWEHYFKCLYLIPLSWILWILFLFILFFIMAPVVLLVDSIRFGAPFAITGLAELWTEAAQDTQELWDRTWQSKFWKGPNAP